MLTTSIINRADGTITVKVGRQSFTLRSDREADAFIIGFKAGTTKAAQQMLAACKVSDTLLSRAALAEPEERGEGR